MTDKGLSTSRFYMWRALFALAHADGVVSEQEMDFLNKNTEDLRLSSAQREILSRDLVEEQDPAVMFAQVTEGRDREEFFTLARVLCWSDGDYDAQERRMMALLTDIQADKEAKALLQRTRNTVHEIHLHQDQWDGDKGDSSVFSFFKGLLKKA